MREHFERKGACGFALRTAAAVLLAFFCILLAGAAGRPAAADELSAENSGLIWNRSFGSGWEASPTPVCYANGKVYTAANENIYALDPKTGEVLAKGNITGSIGYAMIRPTYAEWNGKKMIFLPVGKGHIQCFDAETLQSLWIGDCTAENSAGGETTEEAKRQTISPVTFRNGFVYTGTWTDEATDGTWFALDVTDKDPQNATEVKKAAWAYSPEKGGDGARGFYWAGAAVTDQAVIVGSDDGVSERLTTGSERSILYSFDPASGDVKDRLTDIVGDIRSGVVLQEGSVYFATRAGRVYKVGVNSDGTFDRNRISACTLADQNAITGTPAVVNGRIYVGIQGTGGGLESDGGHAVAVIRDTDRLSADSLVYKTASPGYVQQAVYVRTLANGKNRVYFTYNAKPGGISYFDDADGQTAATQKRLYTPTGSLAQYCVSPIEPGPDDLLYYKNDSGNIFAIGDLKAASPQKIKVRVNLENGKPAKEYTVSVTPGQARTADYGYSAEHPEGSANQIAFADVMAALHDQLYAENAPTRAGPQFEYNSAYGSYGITKLFEKSSSSFGYKVNDLQQGSHTAYNTTAESGDLVSVYFVEGTWPKSTQYYFYKNDKAEVDEDGKATVTVLTTGYDENYNEAAKPAAGAHVTFRLKDGTKVTGVSDANGLVSVQLPKSGTYTFVVDSVEGAEYTALPAERTVTWTKPVPAKTQDVKVRVNLENGKPAQEYMVSVASGQARKAAFGYDKANPEGSADEISFADVMAALHEKLYSSDPASEAGPQFEYNSTYGSYGITKLFEKSSASFGYKVNDLQQGFHTAYNTTVESGDVVSVYYVEGAWPKSTQYYFYKNDKAKVDENGKATLTVLTTGYDENYNEVAKPAAGAHVTFRLKDGTQAEGVSDANGLVSVQLPKSGTYTFVVDSVDGAEYTAMPAVRSLKWTKAGTNDPSEPAKPGDQTSGGTKTNGSAAGSSHTSKAGPRTGDASHAGGWMLLVAAAAAAVVIVRRRAH